MKFVLDCSIVMGWCFEDQSNALTERALNFLRKEKALVPSLLFLEVGNVLVVAERKGILKEADSTRFMELVQSLPLIMDETPTPFSSLVTLARQHELTVYDATYLDLAMKSGLPLATRDKALVNACKKTGLSLL